MKLFCLWKSMSLVLGNRFFFPSVPKKLVRAPLTWFWCRARWEGIAHIPAAIWLCALPGERRLRGAANLQLSQEAPGETVWSCVVIVTIWNISSLLHLNTNRQVSQQFVNNFINVTFGNKDFVASLSVMRRRTLLLAIWAKLQRLQAAILQAVKVPERQKTQMPACQPPWRRWMGLSMSQ